MGALALNSDPEKNSAAAKKAAAARINKNADVFREMGKLGKGRKKRTADYD